MNTGLVWLPTRQSPKVGFGAVKNVNERQGRTRGKKQEDRKPFDERKARKISYAAKFFSLSECIRNFGSFYRISRSLLVKESFSLKFSEIFERLIFKTHLTAT